jgi:ADP-ribose diphosphatase
MSERPAVGRLSSTPVYQGRVVKLSLDLVRLPNGNETSLEMIRHPGAAVALPVERPHGGEPIALLVRQYRYASDGYLLEVPGGKLDGPEDPVACARRELAEEIGHKAGAMESLGWIWTTPGFTDEKIWLYLASDLSPLPEGSALEEDEVLEIHRLPLHEAVTMAGNGEITDAKTVAALLRAARLLGI